MFGMFFETHRIKHKQVHKNRDETVFQH